MSLSTPQQIMERLEEIEEDLGERQNRLETAALDWYRVVRDRDLKHAQAYMAADGQVTDKKQAALLASSHIGVEEEAAYESLKAACRVLETRSTIGMSLLKAQGRA